MPSEGEPRIAWTDVDPILGRALAEDCPDRDLTTDAILPTDGAHRVTAIVHSKATGVLAGLPFAERLAAMADARLGARSLRGDGERIAPGDAVLRVDGPARAVLRAERPILNVLQHLSGVATLTARFVDAVAGTGARICDTRKTLPGLRALERHAVRSGGGEHHRASLSAAVLVKENHVRALAGSIPDCGDAFAEAIRRAVAIRQDRRDAVRIGIEAETVEQALAAAAAGVDLVLLDDFPLDALREAVRRIRERFERPPLLEASGGVSLETVREIAGTGVDRISVGALTHSAPALDLAMKIVVEDAAP